LEYLSDIELYYSAEKSGSSLHLSGEEQRHVIKVMRHTNGDIIYVTDGKGFIYKTEIKNISRDHLSSEIVETYRYENQFSNFIFCIPKLKNPERFEFALEKCTEMGITRFVIYNAVKGVVRGNKKERWERIIISAMKQSLRSFLPELIFIDKLMDLNDSDGSKILFEQNSKSTFTKDFPGNEDTYLIFGPEGGFDSSEITGINYHHSYKISPNRLRTETAVIKAASVITSF
jgi:16S rRNA (uracil1498-N3)-methyltransferase